MAKDIVFLTIDKDKRFNVREYTFSKDVKLKDAQKFLEKECFNKDTEERFFCIMP